MAAFLLRVLRGCGCPCGMCAVGMCKQCYNRPHVHGGGR